MPPNSKSVLLLSMPFASIDIPSIQLSILEGWLNQRNIKIDTKHLYLKAAEFYGINNYNYLILPPNDSYTAQMIYSKYVFPNHWKTYRTFFEKYYEDSVEHNNTIQQPLSFKKYEKQTDLFYSWAIENIGWQDYDIIGFTLNYGQFLPSLAVAKHIKNQSPQKKIVFGGSRTTGNLGRQTLKSFDYIDYIVSGDGEDTLTKLAANQESINTIPGLIYKDNNEIIWNTTNNSIDLNNNPCPSYDTFYRQLVECSPEIQQFFNYYGRLPIEISRGCWWNRCTFCNLNLQHPQYREKTVDTIINEIDSLSEKYKMLSFQIIGNTLPKHELNTFLQRIIALQKDFTFYAEARADRLKRKEYRLLKKAGFTIIQTGIESLSRNYLSKINKGTRVIDNIAVLKFCKENNIKNQYNLIINYPNEEPQDFEESQNTIEIIKQYLDPPTICQLKVVYGSTIQQHPDQFNIQQLTHARIDKVMFPHHYLQNQFNFVYDFKKEKTINENNWNNLISEWQEIHKNNQLKRITSPMLLDELIFYYVDGSTYLKIYDKRQSKNIQIFVLNEIERKIFLSCLDITSLQTLQQHLPINSEEMKKILDEFIQLGIMYSENDYYLSLPLSTKTEVLIDNRCNEIYQNSIKSPEIII